MLLAMGIFVNGKCRSTAHLVGKTVIVTGSNTGIGKVTAADMAKRGARVIMACRNTEKAESAAASIRNELVEEPKGEVIVKKLDLSSLDSVRHFCSDILIQEPRIDILVNNAGVMACPFSLTVDGFETQFATNHLGHFLLTLTLLPTIIASAPARIINVSSVAHTIVKSVNLDTLNSPKNYSPVQAYGRSKLANILFTKELARRLEGTDVTVHSLHPGVVNTELSRHLDSAVSRCFRWVYERVGPIFMKNAVQGAQTTLYCAYDEKVGKTSGLYYADCAEVRPSRLARDEALARELWDKSAEMVNLPAKLNLSPK